MNLKETCESVLRAAEKAIETPYSAHGMVGIFKGFDGDVETKRFLKISANSAAKMARALLVMEEPCAVIKESDTVFNMAANRVENCRCQNESCELCLFARTIIRQVEVQRKALSKAEEIFL